MERFKPFEYCASFVLLFCSTFVCLRRFGTGEEDHISKFLPLLEMLNAILSAISDHARLFSEQLLNCDFESRELSQGAREYCPQEVTLHSSVYDCSVSKYN